MSNQASTVPTNPTCPDCGTPLASGALAGMCPACLLRSGVAADSVTQAGRVPFVPPTVEELATLFPALEIIEFVGKGGMGAVYKARQRQLDRIVALKVLPPALGDDATFAERFAREARALAKLNHPGIVTLYEFGHVTQPTGPLFYILMEFVDGVNLRQLLSGGRISPREALAIVPQICDALQFAHDRGIVHRDIKPENLLIDRRGAVKVADFGLAKLVGTTQEEPLARSTGDASPSGEKQTGEGASHSLTGDGRVMGTPRYMAPEQSERPSEVDHRADIYALGVVFYQMLTGELPAKELRPPSTKVQIDVRLDEIVLRALERNPALRYAAVSEMKTQVETVAGSRQDQSESQPEQKLSSQEETPTPQRRGTIGRALIWAIMVFAVTVGLAAVAGLFIDPIYASQARLAIEVTLPGGVLRLGTSSDYPGQWLQSASSDSALMDLLSDPRIREGMTSKIGREQATRSEILSVLRQSMELKRSRTPTVIEVLAYDKTPERAATNADAIAESLRKLRLEIPTNAKDESPAIVRAKLIDRATQPRRPVYPNWYAIISVCALLSLVTGLFRLRLSAAASPRPWEASRPITTSAIGLALAAVWWSVAFPIVGFTVGSLFGSNGWAIVTFIMILSLPFVSLLAKRQSSAWMAAESGRSLLRVMASVGWAFTVPGIGFAVFFLESFISSTGGWNPAPAEALAVPTIFLGSVLLPAAATLLWRASGPSPRISIQRIFASSAAVIAIMLTLGIGVAVQTRARVSGAQQVAAEEQAELKSRAANQPDAKSSAPSASATPSGPAKVIVLTRATNNLVGTTTDVRTVKVWSDSFLTPGERLEALSEHNGSGLKHDHSALFIDNDGKATRTSSSLGWTFQERFDFGATEADRATSQIQAKADQGSLTLVPGTAVELFRVTNRNGSVLAGSIRLAVSTPAQTATGKPANAVVRLRPYSGLLLFFTADVPPGFRLQAADNLKGFSRGDAHTTQSSLAPSSASWTLPSRDFESDAKELSLAQMKQLAARGPLTVVAGQPAEVFSITNTSGDVYKGFLELVGPKDGATGP